jgi:hypothetical protein
MGGDTHRRGVVWNIADHDGICTNLHAIPNPHCTDYFCARTNRHIVTDCRATFSAIRNGDLMPNFASRTNLCIFGYHNSKSMPE